MADRQDTELNGGAESNESATIGNRPATGARLVDNPAGLPSGFGGGQEATDFLGLSQELGGMDSAPAPGAGVASGRIGGWVPVEADPSPTWLLSEQEPGLEAAEPEEALPEAGDSEANQTVRSRRFLSVAAAALIIGAAVTVAMKFSDRSKTNSPPRFAAQPSDPRPTKTPDPSELSDTPDKEPVGRETILQDGETVAVTETPVETGSPVDGEPSETAASTTPGVETSGEPRPDFAEVETAPRQAAGRLAEWMSANGWAPKTSSGEDTVEASDPAFPSSPAGWSVTAALAFATRSPLALPGASSPDVADRESPARDASLPSADVTFRDGQGFKPSGTAPTATGSGKETAFVGALRLASAEDMAGIWNANVVPPDALDSRTRILTPAVGNVHVVLKTGEIFDGRLYAVGQGQVWLETDIGRLALSAEHVLRIDQVVSDKDAKVVDALPRMRVRTPGGLFFGKVLSRDEQHVTLLLEGGGRITLESTDIEAAPLGDTRVIGPIKPD